MTVFILTILFVYLVSNMSLWEQALRATFPSQQEFVYARLSLFELVKQHLAIVAISSLLAIMLGVGLGVYVTRPSGRAYLQVVDDLTSLAQTFPPVAVLALVVPFLGFGFKPTVFALFLYSILPVIRNTVSGIRAVPNELVEVARGMGMSRVQILLKVEIKLAMKVIMAGIRTSVVINVGTATIGAVVGAGGLGVPIISGLVRNNPAIVLEGAVAAAMLAFVIDQILAQAEASFSSAS